MRNTSRIFLIFLWLAPLSCSIGPEPIAYGEAACHFCSMTIVDKQHAAQMVTDKGKIYNFDALECMLNHLNDVEDEKVGMLLTNTYLHPGELYPVDRATFLKSEGIPSPMGEFLTAFRTHKEALEALEQHKGELLDWKELRTRFKSN